MFCLHKYESISDTRTLSALLYTETAVGLKSDLNPGSSVRTGAGAMAVVNRRARRVWGCKRPAKEVVDSTEHTAS